MTCTTAMISITRFTQAPCAGTLDGSMLSLQTSDWMHDWGEEECQEALPYVCDLKPMTHTETSHCHVLYNAAHSTFNRASGALTLAIVTCSWLMAYHM